MANINPLDPMDLEAATAALGQMAKIFSTAENVHTHNPVLGKHCREIFYPIDTKYQLSANQQPFAVVHAEISAAPDCPPEVKTVLATIQSNSGKVEAETGLEVQQLLCKAWCLAKHPLAPKHSRELILDNLRHNIKGGGGCFAGISGRLIHAYTLLVKSILEMQFVQQFQPVTHNLSSEEQLELTLTISESQADPKQNIMPDEEELQLAVVLSESEAQQPLLAAYQQASTEAVQLNPVAKKEQQDTDLVKALKNSLKLS